MGKKSGRKKNRKKIFRDEHGEYRWEYYFVGGKQKKSKVRVVDGEDFDDDYIRNNADDIWLHQNGMWDIIHERQNPTPDTRDGDSPVPDEYLDEDDDDYEIPF